MNIAKRFADPSVQKSVTVNLALVDRLDELIHELELYLVQTAKVDDVQTYHRLQTIPGVGKVLALVLLYEMHDVSRFETRRAVLVVRAAGALSARVGREKAGLGREEDRQCALCAGPSPRRRACSCGPASGRKKWKQKQAAQRGEGKALAILAARLARAVYHMLRKGEAFDEAALLGGAVRSDTYGFLFPVPPGGEPCQRLIFDKRGRTCVWQTCSICLVSPPRPVTANGCGDPVRCMARGRRAAGRLRPTWARACGIALAAALAATFWTCGSP